MDNNNNKIYDAIVVGAGIAGLYQLHKLREMGKTVLSLEAAPAVGGTWYWNCYPGARVDSQSYIYQYWFSQELIDEWSWSERFPAQAETERYLNFVADKLDLRRDIQFNTKVNAVTWDEKSSKWRVATDQGDNFECQYIVSCTGMLSEPQTPQFEGLDRFKGELVHTARYPREGMNLSGKRVGVIGCGATGIQVIQTIADEVAELKAFQRTPAYGVAMRNYKIDEKQMAVFREKAGETKERLNETFGGFKFDFDNGSWYDATPEERINVMEEAWADGSLACWIGTYPEVFTDQEVNDAISEFAREKIRSQLDDEEVAEKLIPQEYGFGTYRVPLENGYYAAFNREHVEIVDVNAAPIECFTETGIQTADRHYELDVVILATGFDAGTGALTKMNIVGRNGASLTEEWSKDIRSTYGLQVHGYPNLFTVAGPLAPATALCNMPTCLQKQVEWISDCIDYVDRQGKTTIEPSQAKQDEWVNMHDEVSNQTLLVKTSSWYTGANIEGKPIRLLSFPGGANVYNEVCEAAASSGYSGFDIR